MGETATSATIVLIVEDEPLVQAMAVDIIEGAGFPVLTVGSAEQAMAVLEREAGVGILFSDVQMPGMMNGKQLAREASRRWPHLRIILTSGYAADGLGDIPVGAAFLAKPYRAEALERSLLLLAAPTAERK